MSRVIFALIALVAMVSSASAVSVMVQAGNGQDTYRTGSGGFHSDMAEVFQQASFDLSGAEPETRMFHHVSEPRDSTVFTYTNHIVGHHVHATYSLDHPVIGHYEGAIDEDIDF